MRPPSWRETFCLAGLLLCMTTAAGDEANVKSSAGFDGLWKTTFGPMRLTSQGDEVHGCYHYQGTTSSISGQIKNGRFIFRYVEPKDHGSTLQGTGWFELTEDGSAIRGKWRADGGQSWDDWRGRRARPQPGQAWLVILEANWETVISEPEYAFGEMLTNYFNMATARHVEVRHRFFHDSTDLRRFCQEIQFLPGPVVLLISTHGTAQGITVNGETIGAETIADGLTSTQNLALLHLSGCAMMKGDFASKVQDALGDRATFPISGYQTNVAWDASAIGDFTFLSLMLIRSATAEQAARQAIAASPFLGTERISGTPFRPLGLTVLPAGK